MAKQNNHTRNPACSQPTKPYVPLPTNIKERPSDPLPMHPPPEPHITYAYFHTCSWTGPDFKGIWFLLESSVYWRVLWQAWQGLGGGGGAADSLSRAWEAWRGESVWMLRWLDTLCWELPWLSLRSNCCCGGEKKRENMNRKKKTPQPPKRL